MLSGGDLLVPSTEASEDGIVDDKVGKYDTHIKEFEKNKNKQTNFSY